LLSRERILEPYGNYFWDFYNPLKPQVKEKLDYVLQIIISVEKIPSKFFRYLGDGIYEIKIMTDGNAYRVFCFFSDNGAVILLHGIQKKTRKTPRNEIERANRLRKNYYETR
jgi:phage-related protein